MRAPTTTSEKFDRVMFGAIAIVSSSVNDAGRSFTCFLRRASGILEPWAGRAKMKTVSVGAAFAVSSGASFTVPVTVASADGTAAVGVFALSVDAFIEAAAAGALFAGAGCADATVVE